MHGRATRPAPWTRLEVGVLLRSFGRAFGVQTPSIAGLRASEALDAYRSFSATCMELALERGEVAVLLRGRIRDEAFLLGSRIRRLLPVSPAGAFALARLLYAGIGIELSGTLPGNLRFGPCSFADRYTPRDCWLMSAFDEGFLSGLAGCADGRLAFSCRLTEGAPCCLARLDDLQGDVQRDEGARAPRHDEEV